MSLIDECLDLKDNYDAIGSRIISFAKSGMAPSRDEQSFIFKYLNHTDYYVRESAAFALFFVWEIDSEDALCRAIETVQNESEEYDVRKWVISALPNLYEKTRSNKIIRVLLELFENDKDLIISNSSLRSILRIAGWTEEKVFEANFADRITNKSITKERLKDRYKNELRKVKHMIGEY